MTSVRLRELLVLFVAIVPAIHCNKTSLPTIRDGGTDLSEDVNGKDAKAGALDLPAVLDAFQALPDSPAVTGLDVQAAEVGTVAEDATAITPDTLSTEAPIGPSCQDNLANGKETDTDCGGPACKKCPNGKRCAAATDCESNACLGGLCSSKPALPTAGLRLWLRADLGVAQDSNGVVTRWEDQSGNGVVFTPYASGAQAHWVGGVTASGNPVIRFTSAATGGSMLTSGTAINLLEGAQTYVLFVVTKPGASQVQYADMLDYNHGTCANLVVQQDVSYTNLFLNQRLSTSLFQVYAQGAITVTSTAFSFLNGKNKQVVTTPSCAPYTITDPQVMTIGGNINYGRYYAGDVAEIAFYNRILRDAEMATVQTFFADKYGL
jgi:hypothetical protein